MHFEAWQTAMRSFEIEFSESLFYQYAGKPTDEIIRLLSEQQDVSIDVKKAAAAKESHFKSQVQKVVARDEIANVVRIMNGVIAMSVASGGDHDVVVAQLTAIGLHDLLPLVVAAEDTDHHKPHPAPFLMAASRMGIAPADCLVWEDSDLGIAAAASAGMAAVDVRGEFHDWVWHERP